LVTRIAIIPARGGSKRIPRKNIVDFCGKPMLAWTVEAARASEAFARVVVSTEDREIADVARAAGADVPFLRAAHHDDVADVSQATLAALQQATGHFGERYDGVVQLMANCPLRTAADITAALAAFDASGADFQISCTRFGWLNPWWAIERDGAGRGKPLFPAAMERRSQELPPLYCPTGAIWIARGAALQQAGTFYGPGHRFEPLDWISAVDIDEADDMAFARAAYAVRQAAET
jgi:N-acylneuraminate cytidylyltransferase